MIGLCVMGSFVCAARMAPAHAAEPARTAWSAVADTLQTADVFANGYHRYNLPRRDLTLHVGDVIVAPELALGAWAGFSGTASHALMMGDLVVTSTELRPVLAQLAQQDLDVTAIHNHLAGEEPQLTYVHFHGQGDAVGLASRLTRVIALTGTPRPVVA